MKVALIFEIISEDVKCYIIDDLSELSKPGVKFDAVFVCGMAV